MHYTRGYSEDNMIKYQIFKKPIMNNNNNRYKVETFLFY